MLSAHRDLRLHRRTLIAGATLLISASLGFLAVHSVKSPGSAAPTGRGLGLPGPTLDRPLSPAAHRTTLGGAAVAWGASLVLPSTTSVQPSDAGPVWEENAGATTIVAVTFPSQGLIVEYKRPVPYSDPQTQYEGLTESLPGSQVIDLGARPAFLIPQNSAVSGDNFGVVMFVVNGIEVRVMGHTDEATLKDIATSVLNGAASS